MGSSKVIAAGIAIQLDVSVESFSTDFAFDVMSLLPPIAKEIPDISWGRWKGGAFPLCPSVWMPTLLRDGHGVIHLDP